MKRCLLRLEKNQDCNVLNILALEKIQERGSCAALEVRFDSTYHRLWLACRKMRRRKPARVAIDHGRNRSLEKIKIRLKEFKNVESKICRFYFRSGARNIECGHPPFGTAPFAGDSVRAMKVSRGPADPTKYHASYRSSAHVDF